MTHEGSPPAAEVDKTPGRQLFNVGAMSDEEIIVLYRGINAAEVEGAENGLAREGIGDDLGANLHDSLGELATQEPERIKGLVSRCARSERDSDRILAAVVAPSLLDYDYEFTRDTLIFTRVDDDRPRDAPGRRHDYASEIAGSVIGDLGQHRLTPAQLADWNARVQAARYRYRDS